MKIISDFHDYYDSVMMYGQDSNVVFNRDPITYDNIILGNKYEL
jgi:hypothetical protein